MLGKTTKTMRAAGTAIGAMVGFRVMESAETPQEEMDNLVTTAINLAVGGGFVVEKFGKQAAPKVAEAATQAAGKYAPKGIAEAIGYYGLGKAASTDLGKLTGQAPREPSAAQERAKAVKAMQSGNLSTLPIQDHEDLMFYLGAAGAGQTPEEVARYAGRFMALTGNTMDDLKDPNNPATKLLYTMVSQAVREGVNVNSMQNLGFGVAGEVGLLPNNPRGQRFADSYLTLPTIQQEQLGLGLGFVGQWNNDRMGLSVGAQTQMGYTFGTQVAPNYTTGQISRSMRLVQPSTPYEYNLSLAKGILTPQNIESGWGIPAANIGATMDLATGLPANYDALNANEDYTRWQWGFEAAERLLVKRLKEDAIPALHRLVLGHYVL